MAGGNTASCLVAYRMLQLGETDSGNITYSDRNADTHGSRTKRFANVYDEDNAEKFREKQQSIMSREIPVLSKLLAETPFDEGYESLAERYFHQLTDLYGAIADTVLLNIYLQNMYNKQNLLKHLLYIVGNLSEDERTNLEIIPLAGISNPDIEIQDLSVKCFEAWGEKRHLPTLVELRDRTNVGWFRAYISDVIDEINEG